MVKADVTAIILTFNEDKHIERCIESASTLCQDIIVVDSFSTDSTESICKNLGVRFYQNAWVNHAHQFNWALDNLKINTGWVIRIDADEYMEPALCDEIATKLSTTPKNVNGYYFNRKYYFMGQWIRYGSMYPVKTLRLWRCGYGRVEQRLMDEHVVVSTGEVGELQGNIVDDNLNSVTWWVEKHNKYATLEMLEVLNQKYSLFGGPLESKIHLSGQAKVKRFIKNKLYTQLPLFLRPSLYFIYRYFIRLGFLDGKKGIAFHFMQGFWYRMLVDLKVMEGEIWIQSLNDKESICKKLEEKSGVALR